VSSKSTWRANIKSQATLLSTCQRSYLRADTGTEAGWNPEAVDMRTLRQPKDTYPSFPKAIPMPLAN
jgi:hypothetical protein